MNDSNKCICLAHKLGYVVLDDGSVRSPSGKTLSKRVCSNGYMAILIYDPDSKKRVNVAVHRLCAYQLFGDKVFTDGIQVRHVDGNCLNNSHENILIGTASENNLDKPKSVRLKSARIAASKNRKLSRGQVIQLRQDRDEGMTYSQLMNKYEITKSTVSYIVNRKTYDHDF